MIGGDHTALVLISHQESIVAMCWMCSTHDGQMRGEGLAQEEPTWTMTPDEAAELGSRRRGVEPLRIVVMPQRVQQVTVAPQFIEPMPVLV